MVDGAVQKARAPMTRIRHALLCCLLCLACALSVASSGRAVGGALRLAAGVVILAGALAELSHAVTLVAAPESTVHVCRVEAGGSLRVLGYTQDLKWAKVKTRDGRIGWVPTHQLPRDAQPE